MSILKRGAPNLRPPPAQHMNSKLAASFLLLVTSLALKAETVWLDSLDLANMRQGYGNPQVNRAIRETPLAIAGTKFDRGVGTHANSVLWLDLAGGTGEVHRHRGRG